MCQCVLLFPQLLDIFLNEKWSDYVNAYPELPSEQKMVAPSMVHGLLNRLTVRNVIMYYVQYVDSLFKISSEVVKSWHVNC